jgi:hypothetical protein
MQIERTQLLHLLNANDITNKASGVVPVMNTLLAD